MGGEVRLIIGHEVGVLLGRAVDYHEFVDDQLDVTALVVRIESNAKSLWVALVHDAPTIVYAESKGLAISCRGKRYQSCSDNQTDDGLHVLL